MRVSKGAGDKASPRAAAPLKARPRRQLCQVRTRHKIYAERTSLIFIPSSLSAFRMSFSCLSETQP